MITAGEIKAAAKRFGADLAGIASTEILKYLPAGENPLAIFPQGKNVIVIGRRILRGSVRGIEEGTEMADSFEHYGFYYLEDQYLSRTTYDLNIYMENRGFEAVPLFAYDCDHQKVGIPVAPGKPEPNVMLKYRVLAQAAGLGEVGKNGLFITPEFGPLQRFAILITDADVEPDTPFKPYLCNSCNECVSSCPLGALDAEQTQSAGFAGCPSQIAMRDDSICRQCKNGAIQTNEGRFNTVERIAASCGRSCVRSLAERHITRPFKNPFRDTSSNAWQRNLFGEKI